MTLTSRHMDHVVLLLSLPLMNAYLLFDKESVIGLAVFSIPYVLFWLIIFKNSNLLFFKPRHPDRSQLFFSIVLILFVLMFAVSILRLFLASIMPHRTIARFLFPLLTMGLFGLAIVDNREAKEIENIKLCLYISLILYIFFAVFLHLAGVENYLPDTYLLEEKCKIAGMFGLDLKRISLPLGDGKNVFGVVSSLALTLTLAMAVHRYLSFPLRIFAMVMALFVTFAVLVTDSRTGVLAALLTILVVYSPPHYPKFKSVLLVVLIPLAPIILSLIQFMLLRYGLITMVAREASDDISSGRFIIWAAAGAELAKLSPIHLIGYGFNGHAISGVSLYYAQIFRTINLEDPTFSPLHNLALQLIFDHGYLGLLLTLLVFYQHLNFSFKRAYSEKRSVAGLDAVILVYMVIAGSGGSAVAFYNQNLFFVLLMVLITNGGEHGQRRQGYRLARYDGSPDTAMAIGHVSCGGRVSYGDRVGS